MTHLECMIKHYTKEAKRSGAAVSAAAYASGVVHTLSVVKEIRDALEEEADELWETRDSSSAPEERERSVELIRAIIERFDEMDDPQE